MKNYTTHIIKQEHVGMTVEQYLKQIVQISGRKIQKLTRQKGVLLNKKPVFLQKIIKLGEILSVLTEEDNQYGVQPEQNSISILYHDEHMIVVNKPPNQLVHPTGQTDRGTTANYLAGYLQNKSILCTIRPLHRLDRNTSGCVIFANDATTQFRLERQMRNNELKRIYVAIVKGTPQAPSGTITAPIGPHPSLPNRRAIADTGDLAITHYRTIACANNHALLELSLETGRTHQIRVHLAHLGCPILGDTMYGVRSSLITRQALHAISIRFYHLKNNQMLTVQAPLPSDFVSVLESLKLNYE